MTTEQPGDSDRTGDRDAGPAIDIESLPGEFTVKNLGHLKMGDLLQLEDLVNDPTSALTERQRESFRASSREIFKPVTDAIAGVLTRNSALQESFSGLAKKLIPSPNLLGGFKWPSIDLGIRSPQVLRFVAMPSGVGAAVQAVRSIADQELSVDFRDDLRPVNEVVAASEQIAAAKSEEIERAQRQVDLLAQMVDQGRKFEADRATSSKTETTRHRWLLSVGVATLAVTIIGAAFTIAAFLWPR